MKGTLITAMSSNREVRIYVAETTQMVEAARIVHDLSPTSADALGRTITAASIMGMMSKIDKEKLTLQIKGSGEIGLMIAIADTHGNVKAYTSNPHAKTHTRLDGKLSVGDAVGIDGKIIVIRDYGMKEPFIGQSTLVSGEIGDDLAYYFMQSEQQPTAIGLGVLLEPSVGVRVAGGFIVQLLPETTEATIEQLEANLKGLQGVTQMFQEGLTIEQIAAQVMAGLGIDALESYDLFYRCDCSKEKMTVGLGSIGKDALMEIITEDGQAETVCHFCKKIYTFTKEELEAMIAPYESAETKC